MITEQEELTLRHFCDVVAAIHDCRFIHRVSVQDHTIRVDRDLSKNYLPHYDRDDFRSFATLFRKLIATKEPTQLFRLMKILKRCAPDKDKASFKGIRAGLNQEANNPPIMVSIGPPGAEVPFTPKKICDVLFNGYVFHTDPRLQDDVARLLDFQPIVIAMFLRYACLVVNVATQYAAVIKHHDYFKSPTPELEGLYAPTDGYYALGIAQANEGLNDRIPT